MRLTRILRQQYKPSIHFLGKRHTPKSVDHSPHAHPQAPTQELPESFAEYRGRAQQHGPLGGGQQPPSPEPQQQSQSSKTQSPPASTPNKPYGAIGGRSGRQLGNVEPGTDEVWDRNELPARFRRRIFSEAEIDAIQTGGASMWS